MEKVELLINPIVRQAHMVATRETADDKRKNLGHGLHCMDFLEILRDHNKKMATLPWQFVATGTFVNHTQNGGVQRYHQENLV